MPQVTDLVALNKYLGFVDKEKNSGLKRLKPQDKQVVLLAIEGHSAGEIVDMLGMSSGRVRSVLSSAPASKIFDDFLSFKDREFQLLYSLSIDAIRNALRSPDLDVALRAAEKYLKAHGKFDGGRASVSDTAEDVVRRIMEIKVTEERPARMVEL